MECPGQAGANTPNFLQGALDKSACAPFFKERRMKFVEPIGLNRKIGAEPTCSVWANLEVRIWCVRKAFPLAACEREQRKGLRPILFNPGSAPATPVQTWGTRPGGGRCAELVQIEEKRVVKLQLRGLGTLTRRRVCAEAATTPAGDQTLAWRSQQAYGGG